MAEHRSTPPDSQRSGTFTGVTDLFPSGFKWVLREQWPVVLAYVVLVGLVVAGFLSSPFFGSYYNLTSIFRGAAALCVVGLVQTLVMISGGVDMSVSAVITLSAITSAGIMAGQTSMIAPAVGLSLGIGLLFGLVNGIVIVFLKVHPFMATLGTMTIGQGIVLISTRGPVGSIPSGYRFLSSGTVGYVPVSVLIIGLVFAVSYFLLNHTGFGTHLFAVGGDTRVSQLAGIRVRVVQMIVYLVSGLGAAVAGLYLVSRMGVGAPNVGPGFELDSITAAIIGGTPFGGGKGSLVGTLAGVFILAVISNLLNMWNLPTWYQQTIRGGILLLAVSIYSGQARD